MHVVAHVLAQRGAPVALGGDVLGPGDRQRRDGLDGEPALVVLGRVGLVELLAADLGRRRLVHPDLGVEAAGGLRRALHHQVAADLVEVVAQPVREASGGGVEQQPRRLDRVAGDRDHPGPLEAGDAVADVVHAGGPAGALVDLDAGDHAVGADLGAVGERVGDVGDQRRGLGVDLAALQAEAAVDAVRPVAEAAVGDRDRADLRGDAELVARRAGRSRRCRRPGAAGAGRCAGRPTASPPRRPAVPPRSPRSTAAGRRSRSASPRRRRRGCRSRKSLGWKRGV